MKSKQKLPKATIEELEERLEDSLYRQQVCQREFESFGEADQKEILRLASFVRKAAEDYGLLAMFATVLVATAFEVMVNTDTLNYETEGE